jgi:hypothetical protein
MDKNRVGGAAEQGEQATTIDGTWTKSNEAVSLTRSWKPLSSPVKNSAHSRSSPTFDVRNPGSGLKVSRLCGNDANHVIVITQFAKNS